MRDKIINAHDNKKYMFSTYFIINNGKLFSTNNFNFEDNLKNCFYIKKHGSNVLPVIYVDTKIDDEWVTKNQLIGDYNALMEFVSTHENSFICIRGFSRANIAHFIRMINESKGTNIKPVKFKSKLSEAKYERYLLTKEQRMEKLHQKLEDNGSVESSSEYMKISNKVFGERRHKSRIKVMQLRKNNKR